MKVTQTLLPLAALVGTAFSAPTSAPAEGASFPITDLLDSDLTVDEYAQSLEKGSLAKRQYNGDTFNQLTDGTACRPVTVIFARGTTSPGNVGEAGSEGPSFFNALASVLGGASRLAIQGVNYPGMYRLVPLAVQSLTSKSRRSGFLGWRQRCWSHYHVQLDQHCKYCTEQHYQQSLTPHRLLPSAPQPRSLSLDTARVLSLCTLPRRGSRRHRLHEYQQVSHSIESMPRRLESLLRLRTFADLAQSLPLAMQTATRLSVSSPLPRSRFSATTATTSATTESSSLLRTGTTRRTLPLPPLLLLALSGKQQVKFVEQCFERFTAAVSCR